MPNIYNGSAIIISGGGGAETPVDKGPIYEGKYRVRYFDVDGTVLKIEYVANGEKTTPPDAPSYDPDYLIFEEWNYDIDNYIVEKPTDIGATYKTVDDATYMFCKFTTNTGLNPALKVSNFTYIDWGDGTVDTNTSHTYANEGEYIIKIYGDINIDANSSSQNLMGSIVLNKALQKFYIKNNVTSIGNYAFYVCVGLTIITIPKSVTSISSNAFYACYGLKSITIPKSVTSIGSEVFSACYGLKSITIPEGLTIINDSMFYNCYNLESITIPKSVTSIGNQVFYSCYGLKSIIIPEGVRSIGNSAFTYCTSLAIITIPKSVTSIGGSAFSACYCITNYFMNFDTIPTLSNTNVFSSINPTTIMWIKDSIIAQLKTATNWSNYAGYMKPLSWYPSLTEPNA